MTSKVAEYFYAVTCEGAIKEGLSEFHWIFSRDHMTSSSFIAHHSRIMTVWSNIRVVQRVNNMHFPTTIKTSQKDVVPKYVHWNLCYYDPSGPQNEPFCSLFTVSYSLTNLFFLLTFLGYYWIKSKTVDHWQLQIVTFHSACDLLSLWTDKTHPEGQWQVLLFTFKTILMISTWRGLARVSSFKPI